MQPEQIVGVISISLLVLSVSLLMLNLKEGKYSFLALAFYFVQIILLDLVAVKIISLGPKTAYYAGVMNNLLDAPTMLIFLLYFAKSEKSKKLMAMVLGGFVVYETLIWLILGMNNKSLILIIGPGLAIVTIFSFYFFIDLMKGSIFQRKDVGKGFIAGGLVFSYLCFLFIYVIFYIMKSPHIKDIYTIYHVTFIIWCLTLIIGVSLIARGKKAKPPIRVEKTRKEDPNAFQYL